MIFSFSSFLSDGVTWSRPVTEATSYSMAYSLLVTGPLLVTPSLKFILRTEFKIKTHFSNFFSINQSPVSYSQEVL
jgi:hypothetical protein